MYLRFVQFSYFFMLPNYYIIQFKEVNIVIIDLEPNVSIYK